MVGHSQRGETPQTVRVVLRHKLIPAALGLDALSPEALTLALARAVPGNLRAKGALIMAAYDLAGRTLGTPVYNLLGGLVRDRVPLSWSLPIVDESAVLEEAGRMVERGWRILKVKIGRPDAARRRGRRPRAPQGGRRRDRDPRRREPGLRRHDRGQGDPADGGGEPGLRRAARAPRRPGGDGRGALAGRRADHGRRGRRDARGRRRDLAGTCGRLGQHLRRRPGRARPLQAHGLDRGGLPSPRLRRRRARERDRCECGAAPRRLEPGDRPRLRDERPVPAQRRLLRRAAADGGRRAARPAGARARDRRRRGEARGTTATATSSGSRRPRAWRSPSASPTSPPTTGAGTSNWFRRRSGSASTTRGSPTRRSTATPT